jgi:HAD superfamily hydrolase (TIGR01509 family)
MIKAVLFDMDGVICDSMPLYEQSTQKVIEELGGKVELAELRDFAAFPATQVMKILLNRFELDSALLEKAVQRKHEVLLEIARDLKPFPGAIELFDSLKRDGFKLAIGSSSRYIFVNFVAQKFALEKYFDGIFSTQEVSNGKPFPDIYLFAAKQLGVSPQECVVVEDAWHGIDAAKAAGMKCIAVTNTFSAEKLKKADRIVDSLEELSSKDFKKMGVEK